jgi:hypothetical protein
MGTDLFKSIAEAMKMHDSFLKQRSNCAKDLGHSTYQKVTAALRKMAYGIPVDLVDDNLAMGKSQAINCVKRFALVVVKVFGAEYLRAPNAQDRPRLLEINVACGFPGTLGSIDCMQ